WPGHVAIYAGDGQIIDASGSQQQVVERSIWGTPTGFVTYR
ncbi:MAG: hydrolase, partial [Brachybacterium sp.]